MQTHAYIVSRHAPDSNLPKNPLQGAAMLSAHHWLSCSENYRCSGLSGKIINKSSKPWGKPCSLPSQTTENGPASKHQNHHQSCGFRRCQAFAKVPWKIFVETTTNDPPKKS